MAADELIGLLTMGAAVEITRVQSGLSAAGSTLKRAYAASDVGLFAGAARLYIGEGQRLRTLSRSFAALEGLTAAHVHHLLGETHFFDGRFGKASRAFRAAETIASALVARSVEFRAAMRSLALFYKIERLEAEAFEKFGSGSLREAQRLHYRDFATTIRAVSTCPEELPRLRRRLVGHQFYTLSRIFLCDAIHLRLRAGSGPSRRIRCRGDPASGTTTSAGGLSVASCLTASLIFESYSEMVNPMWS